MSITLFRAAFLRTSLVIVLLPGETWDLGPPLVAEVQQHLDPTMVRVVTIESPAGLRRNTIVRALGVPICAGPALARPCSLWS